MKADVTDLNRIVSSQACLEYCLYNTIYNMSLQIKETETFILRLQVKLPSRF